MALPPVDRRTLRAAYDRALAEEPDELAQLDRTTRYTTAESHDRSLRIAGGFGALGVARQEPVAALLDNSLDAAHVWSGLGLGGMVEVPVNTAYKGSFLAHVLNDSAASTLVVDDAYVERVARIAGDLTALRTLVVRGDPAAADGMGDRPGLRVVAFDELTTAAPAPVAPVDAGELMAYMYTSGTTGLSKGVLITHAHAYTYGSREDQERPRRGDRLLVTLPMFHLTGLWYGIYQGIIHRCPVVLEPAFSVSGFWPTIREHGITVTVMLGAMAELLQQVAPSPDDGDNPLELAVMAPLASDVARFRERFGIDLAAVYGMSEIGAVMNGPPETVVGGECGFAREGYELRLVDGAGADVATGTVGELWVRPEDPRLVMRGYHGQPEKTAEVLVDGWVHTGDAFRRDAEGRFFFSDRMKDALRRRGENVSSFEVERVINEHPDVYESAVVAVPSALTEDDIKAVVVPREGAAIDPRELIGFLIDRLPYFMVPRYLDVAAELPKTPTQKVHKHVLRDSGPTGWDREAAGIVVRRGTR
ncbi:MULTISPECIES: AMP-binding protein [unclassified Pseudonocardia]|uniref:AMP-binding protein n=1 Tax=unclassified Pseudonocardia TaxID=2619320 RepID=UPI00095B6112|nr:MULTISPECIES: AMP-binding protein [unclassified Pseudonocardia]MBN9099909.1 AMP-binding protein [Pseudonocardia sp.]OJY38323.1 MAG: ATP-dependent acyl-CoA ligase [Pseudonocardia sp. 73-21]